MSTEILHTVCSELHLFIEYYFVELLQVTVFSFWMFFLYIVKDWDYWDKNKVAHVTPIFPFGSMYKLVLGLSYWGTAFNEIYEKYKNEPYVGYYDVRKPCLVIRDPELIKLILREDFFNFMDRSYFETNPKDYMVNHLFNLKGDAWRSRRYKLAPAYTSAKMRMITCLVNECCNLLKNQIDQISEENNVIDVKDVLSRFTLDIVATCAFGVESNSQLQRNSTFYTLTTRAMHISCKTLLKVYAYNVFPVVTWYHVFDFLGPNIRDYLTELIRTTIEYRETCRITRLDFLDLLIRVRQNQSILEEPGDRVIPETLEEIYPFIAREGITIEEITAESFLFLIASYEFTCNTMLFCLYELACNLSIQDKLYKEVKRVLERHEGRINFHSLQDMTYMDQVINESMRLYPVVPQLLRNCTENYDVPNSSLVIEKGTAVIIPVYAIHHDPQYYPDPYTFNPENFSAEKCEARHRFVFLPFGQGPRMCLGFRFGIIQVKAVLATLISNYYITPTLKTQIPLKLKRKSFATVPAKPLMLAFTKRQSSN